MKTGEFIMRIIYVSLFLLLLTGALSAQEPINSSNNSSVMIIQKEWYMEVNNPAFEKSPFAPIEDMQQVTQIRKATRRQNEIRARRGLPPLKTPDNIPSPDAANGESPNVYTYKAKIKNTGGKIIKTLVWEYVFYEPDTQQEVGRLVFVNDVNISPGKTKDLKMSSLSPPSNTINVKQTGKKLREQYRDQIFIQSIEFDDGTIWEAVAEPAK